jgi:chorismate-pyruvate lyase
MVLVANRSELRAALESTRTTVTEFLEHLVGESIDAQVHHQRVTGAPSSNDLGVAEGEPLLQRAATLRGRISGTSYVYAESVIATSRLPTRFALRLESGSDPIGRILDEMGISVTRENLVAPRGFAASRPDGDMRVGDHLLARTYRIDSGQAPVMVITEWFLRALNPFLSSP